MTVPRPKQILLVSALLLAPIASGCLPSRARVGTPFNAHHTDDIQVGHHGENEVRKLLGSPHRKSALPHTPKGCVLRWTYSHAKAELQKETPAQHVSVDFDKEGMVCAVHAYTQDTPSTHGSPHRP